MTAQFHPEFPKDVRRFALQYASISVGLAERFSGEIDEAIRAIKRAPRSAGHSLRAKTPAVSELRRRNLHAFPFFILYAVLEDRLIIASVIPSRSDPLTWLARFQS